MPRFSYFFICMSLAAATVVAAVCWSFAAEKPVQAPTSAGKEEPAKTGTPSETTPSLSAEDSQEFFEKQVRPILVARCFECHGPDVAKPQGNLRFTSREALIKGGDTAPAIVPGKSKGLLIDAINYGETYQMPPKTRMPPAEVAVLTRWVEQGANGLETIASSKATKVAPFDLQKRKADHWCWQPIRSPELPKVQQASWPRQPLDRFVLAKLEAEKLSPAPQADRRAIVRRVYFDLIGLPPSAEEAKAFIESTDPAALEKLVDQLLASPQFGERWARHWLDLVRYAESRGHEFDYNSANAWQYRDYVIRAINADLPYDQFVTEQIAGDLLDKPRLNPIDKYNESILGTGFWFLGEWVHSPVDIRADEAERQDNMIDVFGKAFCGLTIACARCHDHKFDAISQKDFYSLAGYLQSSSYRQVAFDTLENHRQIAEKLATLETEFRPRALKLTAETWRHRLAPLRQAVDALSSVDFNNLTDEGRSQLNKAAHEQHLDDQQIAQWIAALQASNKDDRDLLAPLARSLLTGGSSPNRDQAVDSLLNSWRLALRDAAKAYEPDQIILDYDRPGCDAWYSDGYSFGLKQRPTGQTLFTSDANQIVGLAQTHSAAVRDPAFNGLGMAANTELETGRVDWPRAGRTIKTRTVTLSSDTVHFLVRGGGHVYAAVDSHWINHGPLHGSLVHSWKNDGGRPRWITQNLAAYKGQRAHFEFSPDGNDPLEVLMVVQSAKTPPADLPSLKMYQTLNPNDKGGSAFDELTAVDRSPRPMVESYEKLFRETLSRLANDSLVRRAENGTVIDDDSPAWNWLLKHAHLFPESAGDQAAQSELAELSGKYLKAREELVGQIKKKSHAAPAMWEGSSEGEYLLIRGNSKTPGEKLPPRFLTALGGDHLPELGAGNNRLALAKAMLADENPLTARVMVNRIWHHLMGRGIVASTDSFGVLGEQPTNPELLDFLADDFRKDGWSVKRAIRGIILSSSYQMSSVASAEAERRDPANLLLQHARIRRLDAEPIRDEMLAISGRLDSKLFGPSVPVFLTAFMEGRGRPGNSGPLDGDGRRSLYISIRRNFLSPMMLAFDVPSPSTCVGRRNVSNVPAQALMLMNDPLVIEQARLWANHAVAEVNRTPKERVASLYLTAFARTPTDDESDAAVEFLKSQGSQLGLAGDAWQKDPRPWADLCHVIFNIKEFIFLD